MSYTIAVAQRKGGVGKTTVAVSVAAELCRRGKEVAMIDADPQRSACQWAEPGTLKFPVYEIALSDQNATNWFRELNHVAAKYGCVIVDTAASEHALSTSIAVASLVLVPCTPSGLDLEATVRTLEIIDSVRARRQGHPSLILVPNRVDIRTLEGQQIVAELTGFGEVVGTALGDRSAFVRAFSAGKSVADMPEGLLAHREIQLLCNVIEKTLDAIPYRSEN
jgi:chromosome partitioning protein